MPKSSMVWSKGLFASGNTGKATKYIFRQLVALWKDSVRAFINEALKHVHVDTGMSVASFQPLAANVRMQSIIRESLRGRGPRKGHTKNSITTLSQRGSIGPFKSRALGARLGKSPKGYKLVFGTPQNPKFRFEFQIRVFQYYLHEYGYDGKRDPVWNSLEKAKDAFIANWNAKFNDFVNSKIISSLIVRGSLSGR